MGQSTDRRCATRAQLVCPLDATAAKVGVGKVHDRLAQVRVERAGVAQVNEPSRQPDERVLNEILRDVPVAGQQVGKANGRIGMTQVQLADPARARDRRCFRVCAQHLITDPRTRRSRIRFLAECPACARDGLPPFLAGIVPIVRLGGSDAGSVPMVCGSTPFHAAERCAVGEA